MASTERKEWFNVSHSANGNTAVTCTVQEGSLSVKWSVKAFTSTIKHGVEEARKGAYEALAELKEALDDARSAA